VAVIVRLLVPRQSSRCFRVFLHPVDTASASADPAAATAAGAAGTCESGDDVVIVTGALLADTVGASADPVAAHAGTTDNVCFCYSNSPKHSKRHADESNS
jgi:hypothetical protein